jgi:large subunit ribosomal protein L30
MAKKLKVTLIRSGINRPEPQKLTIRQLGLRKMWRSAVLPDNLSYAG